MMQCWIIRFLYEHEGKRHLSWDIEANFPCTIDSHGNSQTDGEKGLYSKSQCGQDARLKKLELTEVGIRMEEGTIRNINQMKHCFVREYRTRRSEAFSAIRNGSNIEIQQEKQTGEERVMLKTLELRSVRFKKALHQDLLFMTWKS